MRRGSPRTCSVPRKNIRFQASSVCQRNSTVRQNSDSRVAFISWNQMADQHIALTCYGLFPHIPRRSSSPTNRLNIVHERSTDTFTPHCAISPLQAPALSNSESTMHSGDDSIEKGRLDGLNGKENYSSRSLFFSIFQMKTISGELIQRSGL
jgi:hypothetical protein